MTKEKEVKFEDKIKELESIINELESGEIDLDSSIEKYEQEASELLSKYRLLYENEKSRDGKYFAFWKDDDLLYCEGCDEDLQIYYGIIFSHPISSLVNSK